MEKRGSSAYTHTHVPATPAEAPVEILRKKETRIVTEIAEDAEKTVIELCGKIQKFYPARWEKAAKNGGKLSTMAGNFRNFLQEIDDVLQDNPDTRLQPKWQARVDKYKQIYREEIEQHL